MNLSRMILVAIVFVFSFAACDQESKMTSPDKGVTSDNKEHLNKEGTSKFSINVIQSLPEEIEGCGCYFSSDSTDNIDKQFIFVSNYDSTAFISINNRLTRLKLVKSGTDVTSFGDHDHIEVYESSQYKVTVDIKYLKSNGEETWSNQGNLLVEDRFGQSILQKFVGECGC
ncbi:MAG: hypothetical protein ACK4WD_07055 [Flavobacteriales bacterium]